MCFCRRPAPTYDTYRSMCMEIESCGGVADCLTNWASARRFRPPDVFTGRTTTRGTVFEDPSGGLTTAHRVVRSAPVWRTTSNTADEERDGSLTRTTAARAPMFRGNRLLADHEEERRLQSFPSSTSRPRLLPARKGLRGTTSVSGTWRRGQGRWLRNTRPGRVLTCRSRRGRRKIRTSSSHATYAGAA